MSLLTMPPSRPRFRFTVDEYEQMIQYGILTENDRVELIRGEIVEKMSIGPDHQGCVKEINRTFRRIPDDQAVIGVQDPIRLSDSEPETDISVMKYRADRYRKITPRAKDVLLAVEVSDSSLDDDRHVKGPMYAEAGIPEYWIVNLPEECLEVYRSPQSNGTYADKQILHRGQQVEILAFPGLKFEIGDLL